MKVGFTYDLRDDYLAAGYDAEETAEFDQLGTIEAIEAALWRLGCSVDRIGNARALVERLAAGDRWELVFNLCEGLRGAARESQVPAILDVFEIPYTFSDPAVLALCLDKALTKMVLRENGLPTPDWHVVRAVSDLELCEVPFPVIAKPIAEGTGKGIDGVSKNSDRQSLRRTCQRLLQRFGQPVLVEQFLPGREFTVGILGTGQHAEVLGTIEIMLRGTAEPDVYSYTNKENSESLVDYRLGQATQDEPVAQAESIALAAWRVVGGRDAGRLDLRCDAAGQPHLIEINPLAGLHPTHSDLPMICRAKGKDFVDLIRRIVASARKRLSMPPPASRMNRTSLTRC